jgi:hypothetical protein
MTRWILAFAVAAALPARASFVLSSAAGVAAILVPADEPRYLRLAANDLVSDVRRITGRTLPVVIRPEACASGCLVLASVATPSSRSIVNSYAPDLVRELAGKPEAFHLRITGNNLLIAGSDPRGTMWGLYDFIEKELGVDPMYFWTGLAPAARTELSWASIDRAAAPPSFRFRGWFINDEDLLTDWRDGGGPRNIDYPYYAQVTAPEVLDRVFESMLRLKFNLVIPASFTDIENPAEERMVQAATRRGLYVSMHHVEPMGVSAFAFANYWKARGKTVEYSYIKNAAAFHEVWRHYAGRWSKYPDVVWQIGLRGIADRPVWLADKSAPTDDAGRGAMISRAMAEQVRIVREVDKRPDPPITTTLWAEGSYLFAGGHLRIPPEVTPVFADNNSGWQWQSDFFNVPREKGRAYGVYYHHAVWGQGPHLVQAVPPSRTHARFREAWGRNGPGSYVIMNVSNVREFALGLAASSQMTWDVARFDPSRFMDEWTAGRFGDQAPAARRAYQRFFDSYVIGEKRGTPDLLDGLALHEGERLVRALVAKKKIERAGDPGEFHSRGFADTRVVGEELPAELLRRLDRQISGLDAALGAASEVQLNGREAAFFRANLLGQAHILRGICRWTAALASTAVARDASDTAGARKHARAALAAFEEIRAGQAMCIVPDWYRGDRKMDLNRAEQLTLKLRDVL